MLSNGISAPSGLQCSQDSISRSASRRVAASMSTTQLPMGTDKSLQTGLILVETRDDPTDTVELGERRLEARCVSMAESKCDARAGANSMRILSTKMQIAVVGLRSPRQPWSDLEVHTATNG